MWPFSWNIWPGVYFASWVPYLIPPLFDIWCYLVLNELLWSLSCITYSGLFLEASDELISWFKALASFWGCYFSGDEIYFYKLFFRLLPCSPGESGVILIFRALFLLFFCLGFEFISSTTAAGEEFWTLTSLLYCYKWLWEEGGASNYCNYWCILFEFNICY